FGDSGTVTVAINDPSPSLTFAPAPILSFSANPTSITQGQTSTLVWSVANVLSCWTSGWSGTIANSGSQAVTPAQATTYTLTCFGLGGSVSQSLMITVAAAVATSTKVITIETTSTSTVPASFSADNPIVIRGISSNFRFQGYLKSGVEAVDVKNLQIILNSDPDTSLAQSGPGSPGNETNYFGSLTKRAVIKFQDKYADEILAPWQLTNGTGLVGKTTLAKLNKILGR
ncbi:MAG TPA: peptidoglycan-binding domain-containing protein, partial [Candidatus Paceibacterota bacterium]